MTRRHSRIEGFREAADTLATLSRAVQRGVGRTVLREPAALLAGEVQTRAPKLTGLLQGAVKVVNNRLTKKAAREARARPGAVELAVLVDDAAAVPNEFGNEHVDPAQPFFRPAIDAKREEMMRVGAARIKTAVDAAAQRAARRAR